MIVMISCWLSCSYFDITSSISIYFEKSFFSILIKMIAKNAVSNNTNTKELIMDSQWISNVVGKNVESAYLAILWEYLVFGI